MRPGQQNKRGRGRNNNSNNNNNNNNNFRKSGNPLTRTYDSSGPDVKIRGTAQTIAEKYAALARDAQSSGDRVIAENYLQHAEHYNRIILSAQQQMQERHQRDDRSDFNDRDGFDRDQDDGDFVAADDAPANAAPAPAAVAAPVTEAVIDGTGPQPIIEGTPAEVSLEEEDTASARQPSRRRNAPRQRRPRRGETQQGGEEAQAAPADGGDAPVLEAASE